MSRRSAVAADLRTPKYRQRVVPVARGVSKTVFDYAFAANCPFDGCVSLTECQAAGRCKWMARSLEEVLDGEDARRRPRG